MTENAKSTFEKTLEDNKEKIYRICYVYAVAPVEPQDLFQEVTFHIWKAFSTFDGRANITTWVYRIALNVCMRYKSRLAKTNDYLVRLEAIHFEPKALVPDNDMETKHQALQSCIQTLDEINRSIVIMVLDDMSYKQIAEVTGLTENHIAVKMKRVRKTLSKCITQKLKTHE